VAIKDFSLKRDTNELRDKLAQVQEAFNAYTPAEEAEKTVEGLRISLINMIKQKVNIE
jgi:hypothetical protein